MKKILMVASIALALAGCVEQSGPAPYVGPLEARSCTGAVCETHELDGELAIFVDDNVTSGLPEGDVTLQFFPGPFGGLKIAPTPAYPHGGEGSMQPTTLDLVLRGANATYTFHGTR